MFSSKSPILFASSPVAVVPSRFLYVSCTSPGDASLNSKFLLSIQTWTSSLNFEVLPMTSSFRALCRTVAFVKRGVLYCTLLTKVSLVFSSLTVFQLSLNVEPVRSLGGLSYRFCSSVVHSLYMTYGVLYKRPSFQLVADRHTENFYGALTCL